MTAKPEIRFLVLFTQTLTGKGISSVAAAASLSRRQSTLVEPLTNLELCRFEIHESELRFKMKLLKKPRCLDIRSKVSQVGSKSEVTQPLSQEPKNNNYRVDCQKCGLGLFLGFFGEG